MPNELARFDRAPSNWPPTLNVRTCREGDAESLWGLFSQRGFRRFAMMDETPFETPETVKTWLEASGAFRIVGTLEQTVVGFAGLYPLQGRQSHVGWITIGVHEDFHGRGIGTSLLRLVLATATRLAGLRRVQLHILAGNDAAISLYVSHGFRIEGCHEALVQDGSGYVDAFTMARHL